MTKKEAAAHVLYASSRRCGVADKTRSAARQRGAMLVVWTCLGLGGVIDCVVGGITGDWMDYVIGLTFALWSIVMLGTGWWLRWPRG